MKKPALVAISISFAACLPTGPSQSASAAYPAYTSPGFQQTQQDLDNLVAAEIEGKGYAAEGKPVQGTLERFAPLPLSLARGKCYKVVLRLDPNTQFSAHARQGVGFVFKGIDQYGQVNGGPGIAGPGGVGSAGCPKQKAPSATFDLQATFGSALDASRIHDLGQGGYTVQLYSKPISDAELAAIQADENRQIARQEAFMQQECAACARKLDACNADWRRGATRSMCERDYSDCVMTRALQCR
ncbi:MAG TPA: hypothetical protein VIV11_40060 [Kofleriaceae bacterium]